ncbi:MAK10-like protein [Tanacetum coccineum]
MVKNPKLNVNSTSPVLSSCSYPMEDPKCSSQTHNSINAIKTCSNQQNENDQSKIKTLMVNEVGTPRSKEPKHTLEDEFKDLHLNLPVLEVLAHAPIYNDIHDKYVESLELGKNGSAFIQGKMPKKMKDPRLFTLPCRLGNSEPFDTLADLGSCVNLIPLYLFKKLAIGLLEETDHVFDLVDETKSQPVGVIKNVEVHIGRILKALPINLKGNMWELEDLIENPINWDKPPKNGDGAWHAKIRIIDPDGEEFTKTFQSIPTSRKLSEKENPREIIDLDHFHDT